MKITLLKSFLLVGAILSFGLAKAQEVSGTVSDANGPLPGASVVVRGTTNGTQTDFDGNFTINNVDSDATLVISYIGYTTQEVALNGRTTVNVVLAEDAQALDEVVIIGYGTTTVKDATGAVSAINSEDFNGGIIASPEQLIQGKTAGVQITQSSGEPGAGVNIRIRGANSIRSNNSPLFVVDGVPLSSESTTPGGGDITGVYFHFIVLDDSLGTKRIQCADSTNEDLIGSVMTVDTDTSDANASFATQVADEFHQITFNGTTTGRAGSKVTVTNIAADKWHVEGTLLCTGAPATPFS